MAKINDTTTYPNTTPALTDHVPGTDVSNVANDANGETVTFTLQAIMDLIEANGQFTESNITDLQSYLVNLVEDTTPQLGGSLDVNGNKIVSTANGNIDIEPNGTGNVLLGNFVFDADQTVGAGQDNYVLTYDNAAGVISLEQKAVVTESIVVAVSDETTDLTTGTAKTTFRMPYAFTLTGVRASVTTAPTGSALTVDINESGTTILSTKLTIDATEKTSTTAATAAVISDSSLADDAEITIDIDGVGSTVAGAGLKVTLIGYQT